MNPNLDWSEKAQKLLEANLVNLGKKVLAGEPLSASEVKILEAATVKPEADPEPATPAFAQNKAELAAVLGISRQLVQYHSKHGAPRPTPDGRHDVAKWRDYLAVCGRSVAVQGEPKPTRSRLTFQDGFESALDRIGSHLPSNLQKAMGSAGITFKPRQADAATVFLFMLLAANVDNIAKAHGFESVFTPLEDGAPFWPEAIAQAAKRARLKR